MLVLGIDPGTAVTGYGLVREERGSRSPAGVGMKLVECGVIRTRPRDPLPTRLHEIHKGVAELIARHHPDHLAVEDVFYARNVRTTLALGHARGVVLLAGESAGLVIHEFAPAEVKKAIVGSGNATKEQVQFMLTRLLRLRAAPEPADASDGVAAAVTYMITAHMARLTNGVTNGAPSGARARRI
jgi:crossover junction endodeoxyribonuclease RuvC